MADNREKMDSFEEGVKADSEKELLPDEEVKKVNGGAVALNVTSSDSVITSPDYH